VCTRRWVPIDAYFAAAGESWATVGNTRPGTDHNRGPRERLVDEDQEQQAGTPSTSTRTTPTTRRPRP
jgi:hypothetical protein